MDGGVHLQSVLKQNNNYNHNGHVIQNHGHNSSGHMGMQLPIGHHLTPIANSTMRALGSLTDQQSLMVNGTIITMGGNSPGHGNDGRTTGDPRSTIGHHGVPNGNHHPNDSAAAMRQQAHQLVTTLELHPDIVLGTLMEDGEDRPHVCELCNATYKTRTHLRRHMFIHLKARPYPCPECGKGFNRKEHLNKHTEAVHSLTKYKCIYCSKEISRKDHLNRHIKNMHTFPSAVTSRGVTSSDVSMLNHTLPVVPKPKSSRISQISNNNVRHSEGQRQSSSSGILQNIQYVVDAHGDNGNIQFLNFSENYRSLPTQKKSGLELFNCSECSSAFTSQKDLSLHSKTHKPQPYKCNECSRAYTRREKLAEHIRCFHQGQKFNCDICGKDLSRKDHVLRHIRSVHPEVLANRFVEIAESNGLDPTAVIRSSGTIPLQGSNGNNIPSLGEMGSLLRSVCQVCCKVFGTSYHLARHIQSCHNNNVRPFSCNSCSKQFKRKDHLTNHMKSHCPNTREGTDPANISSDGSINRTSESNPSANENETLTSLEGDLSSCIGEDVTDALQIEMQEGHDGSMLGVATEPQPQTVGNGQDRKHLIIPKGEKMNSKFNNPTSASTRELNRPAPGTTLRNSNGPNPPRKAGTQRSIPELKPIPASGHNSSRNNYLTSGFNDPFFSEAKR